MFTKVSILEKMYVNFAVSQNRVPIGFSIICRTPDNLGYA